ARGRLLALLVDGKPTPMATGPAEVDVIMDTTPFYAEAGGQQADEGTIEFDSGALVEVDDVQSPIKGLTVHRGRLIEGTLGLGDLGLMRIDVARRRAISRAHTATHIVHQALREELGSTAVQAGSENAPSRLRFDFRFGSSPGATAMSAIEERVNTQLAEDLQVTDEVMPLAKAKELGAMALFGEKYGERVRVVSIGGDWSRELCGGTHMGTSGQIGRVALLGESSIGSGVRRVEALVGDGAYEFHAREHLIVSRLAEILKVRPEEMPERIETLMARMKEADKRLQAFKRERVLVQVGEFAAQAQAIGEVRVVTLDLAEDADGEALRTVAQGIRERLGEGTPALVAAAGRSEERVVLVVAVNQAARDLGIKAGVLAKRASTILGGGGGGRDDFAQGGGTASEKVPQAFDAIRAELPT
ncbi:MAG: DHHA1 domain-containing protein, partial [Micrococcales bacterium]|nr:DHHA1 domain-containing protein [Micrococcales bacterium]